MTSQKSVATDWNGFPGFKIQDEKYEREFLEIKGIYDPLDPPCCERCGVLAEPARTSYEYKTIWDIVPDERFYDENTGAYAIATGSRNMPQVVKILCGRRRYRCPQCRRDVPNLPAFSDGYVTKRFADWIGQESLDLSTGDISDLLNNVLSANEIGKIWRAWAVSRYNEYLRRLSAPENLGLHLISDGKRKFILFSDLEDACVLDLIEFGSDYTGMYRLLFTLSAQMLTRTVCSDIDNSCMVPARGIFGTTTTASSVPIIISASPASLHRVFSVSLFNAIEKHYLGKGKTLLKKYSLLPLIQNFDYLHTDPVEMNRLSQKVHMYADENGVWISDWIKMLDSLRDYINYDWEATTFNEFLTALKKYPMFSDILSICQTYSREIHASFDNPDQLSQYNEITEYTTDLVKQWCTCKPETIRARLIFTTAPDLIPTIDPQTGVFRFAGISIHKLYKDCLRRYGS